MKKGESDMKHILLILLSFYLSESAIAQFRLLQVTEISNELIYYKNKRDPYISGYDVPSVGLFPKTKGKEEYWMYGFALQVNTDLVQYKNFRITWDNYWYFDATNKQVRKIGWKFDLGFPISDRYKILYRHHSRHCSDCVEDRSYPVDNAYILKIKWGK